MAGIAYPFIDPQTHLAVSWRVRRDHPESENGKPRQKYINAYGDRPHIYFPPGAADMLTNVPAPVVLVEAITSALALSAASDRLNRAVLAIALGGCWGWRTSRAGITVDPAGERVNEAGVQPDLTRVELAGRDVVILFDSNSTTNPKVRSAQRRLAETLQSRGAHVRIGTVPPDGDVNGPDDYRAFHDDAALFALVDAAVPIQPPTVEDVLEDSGFSELVEPVDLGALEHALHELADLLRSADPIRRKLVRKAVVARLKALKVDGGAGLVDAAMGLISDEPAVQNLPFLANVTPWPDFVEGAEALDAVVMLLTKYMVLPAHAADAIALWTVHAYLMPVWGTSPILAVLSPVKRCGKSNLLELLATLAPRALLVSNLTTASLFRVVESFRPTLLADEADTWLSDDTSDLRGIFNSGWRRGTAQVLRCVGDEQKPTKFSTWAPKMIAAIGELPGTIEDRSIVVALRRKTNDERVSRFRNDKVEAETAPLRSQLQRWADDHAADIGRLDPDIPNALNDRAMDNWRPLVAIADEAGGHWPARARAAALALSGDEAVEDIGAEVLADIRTIFEEAGDPAAMASAELLKRLVEMEDRPWAHSSKGGNPITGSKLARMLRPFKVFTAGSIRVGEKPARAYRRSAFTDAWTRYLPVPAAFKACQRDNPNETGSESAISQRDIDANCHALKVEDSSMISGARHAVTPQNSESSTAAPEESLWTEL